jgi:hypothetical protein
VEFSDVIVRLSNEGLVLPLPMRVAAKLAHECADGDKVTVRDAASSSKSPLPHVVSARAEAKAFASAKRLRMPRQPTIAPKRWRTRRPEKGDRQPFAPCCAEALRRKRKRSAAQAKTAENIIQFKWDGGRVGSGRARSRGQLSMPQRVKGHDGE